MGGSRIFNWGGLRIDEALDYGLHIAQFHLKPWAILEGGGARTAPLYIGVVKKGKNRKESVHL